VTGYFFVAFVLATGKPTRIGMFRTRWDCAQIAAQVRAARDGRRRAYRIVMPCRRDSAAAGA
jgi:hypothetical protein